MAKCMAHSRYSVSNDLNGRKKYQYVQYVCARHCAWLWQCGHKGNTVPGFKELTLSQVGNGD